MTKKHSVEIRCLECELSAYAINGMFNLQGHRVPKFRFVFSEDMEEKEFDRLILAVKRIMKKKDHWPYNDIHRPKGSWD